MTIEQVVADRLEGTPAVTDLVGTRIYQLKLKQNTAFPAIRVQEIDDLHGHHLRGVDTPAHARVQVDSYGSETGTDPYVTVQNVAAAVAAALDGERFTSAGVRVTGVFQDTRVTEQEPGTTPLIRVRQDFRIVYDHVS